MIEYPDNYSLNSGKANQIPQPSPMPSGESEIRAWLTNIDVSISQLESISQELSPIIYLTKPYDEHPVNEVSQIADAIRSLDLRIRKVAHYLSHHQL